MYYMCYGGEFDYLVRRLVLMRLTAPILMVFGLMELG